MRALLTSAILFTCFTLSSSVQVDAQITGLGFLPASPGYSRASGISDDGTVVTGQSGFYNPEEAFRWTRSGGMVGIAAAGQTRGVGISSDGSTIVGCNFSTRREFQWTAQNGYVELGTGQAWATSANGAYVAVSRYDPSIDAEYSARLDPNSGDLINLGMISGYHDSTPTAISADGTSIVGSGRNIVTDYHQAYRWNENTGIVGLGFLPNGSDSYAEGISNDGSVVVGGTPSGAFRWTQATGMQDIGDVPGELHKPFAYGVSGDGKVIVGYTDFSNVAWVWTEEKGIQSLMSILVAQGDDVSHWQSLFTGTDASYDGRKIVGYGTNVDGNTEAFIANIGAEIQPDSFQLIRGMVVSGNNASLLASDDLDLVLQRNTSAFQPETSLSVKGVCPYANPTELEFQIESSVFSRVEITQEISLYDYNADSWEVVDSRPASRFGDEIVTVDGAGDLSRFVQPSTNCFEARVRYTAQNQRALFSASVDAIQWYALAH